MNQKETYEKIEHYLFESREIAQQALTPAQQEIRERLMVCVSRLLDNPLDRDIHLVSFLMKGCGGLCAAVSRSQAYRDIAAIRRMVGNIQGHSKSWYRYMIVEGAKAGYEIAKSQNDAKGMAANLDKIGKYTRADKEDDVYDWSQLVPPSFEPSDDVSLLEGMKPIADLEMERQEFRKLFKEKMLLTAEDVHGENTNG